MNTKLQTANHLHHMPHSSPTVIKDAVWIEMHAKFHLLKNQLPGVQQLWCPSTLEQSRSVSTFSENVL